MNTLLSLIIIGSFAIPGIVEAKPAEKMTVKDIEYHVIDKRSGLTLTAIREKSDEQLLAAEGRAVIDLRMDYTRTGKGKVKGQVEHWVMVVDCVYQRTKMSITGLKMPGEQSMWRDVEYVHQDLADQEWGSVEPGTIMEVTRDYACSLIGR